jgi:hypothetical protein
MNCVIFEIGFVWTFSFKMKILLAQKRVSFFQKELKKIIFTLKNHYKIILF